MNNQINPYAVAFLSLEPVGATLAPGSYGVTSVTPVVSATSFDIVLSSEFSGGFLAADFAKQFHVTASTKEGASITQAVSGNNNGFRIVFGSALTHYVTIKVEKLVSE